MSETSKDSPPYPHIGSIWQYGADHIRVLSHSNGGVYEVRAVRLNLGDSNPAAKPNLIEFHTREHFYDSCLLASMFPVNPPKPRSLTRAEEIQAQAERTFWEAAACAFVASVPCSKAAGEAPAVADWLTEQWRMRFYPEARRMYEIPKERR